MCRKGRNGMDLMAGGTGAEAGEVEAIRLTSGVDKLSTMMAGTDVSNPLLGRGEAVVTHPVSGRATEGAPLECRSGGRTNRRRGRSGGGGQRSIR